MISKQRQRLLDALTLMLERDPWFSVVLPIRLGTRANDHRWNHWGPRKKASDAQRSAAHFRLKRHQVELLTAVKTTGLAVRVVRCGPAELDSHDNLGMATKAIVDGIADALKINDRDPRVTFVPDGEKGPWGTRIEFYRLEAVQ